jgi:hypothetical protein
LRRPCRRLRENQRADAGDQDFGHDANNDTATDPIVRVAAAEIRKRVAQYYQDPAHHHELHLTLSFGS